MCLPINGVPEFDRPVAQLEGRMSFWDMMSVVNATLKKAGMNQAAAEFRALSEECDGDNGMLFTMALLFIRVPGQEAA